MKPLLWQWTKAGCLDIWTSLADLLFPPVCMVCGKSLVRSEQYLCTGCLVDFPFSDEAYSANENILLQFEEACRPRQLYSLFYYSKFNNYKNLIYRVKYRSHRLLGVYLGKMLGNKIAAVCEADCIVPVPLHPKRERERGFNQAREIALGVSEVTGMEVIDDVLFRVKNNVSQTGKNAAERQKNVENIFEMRNSQKIRGRHILLIDDVITTGATIGSCLRMLAREKSTTFSLGCIAQTM